MTTPPPGSLWDLIFGSRSFQRTLYIGISVENILYGIELLLYFKTMRTLLANMREHRKSNVAYMLFSSVMVFLITVWVATMAIFGEKMWISNSSFPGGPEAYSAENIRVWYLAWGTTSTIVLQLMTDALMIYRCCTIWGGYRVTIIPVILWLAALVLGIAVDFSSSPGQGGKIFLGSYARLSFAYYCVCVALNTTLTCMICSRMMWHGWKVRKQLGQEYASVYFTVVTLVVESALPFTLSGIASLISLGLKSPTFAVFLCVYFMMMCISPQLLILRVVARRAWEHESSGRPGSTLHFNHRDTSQHGSNGARVSLPASSKVYFPDANTTS